MRTSVDNVNGPLQAVNELFKVSVCGCRLQYLFAYTLIRPAVALGYKAFGKLHRDDFLSAFAPKSKTLIHIHGEYGDDRKPAVFSTVTWRIDQQFGGWRGDKQKNLKSSIDPEEVWDMYWHPVRSSQCSILQRFTSYPPHSSFATIGFD